MHVVPSDPYSNIGSVLGSFGSVSRECPDPGPGSPLSPWKNFPSSSSLQHGDNKSALRLWSAVVSRLMKSQDFQNTDTYSDTKRNSNSRSVKNFLSQCQFHFLQSVRCFVSGRECILDIRIANHIFHPDVKSRRVLGHESLRYLRIPRY